MKANALIRTHLSTIYCQGKSIGGSGFQEWMNRMSIGVRSVDGMH